jgi:hypothetical protein
MATVSATFSSDGQSEGNSVVATWVLAGTNDGAPLNAPNLSDKTVQVGVTGDTFGAGTVVIEGSHNGVDWVTLLDPNNTALSFTANDLKQVPASVVYIRPRATVSVTQVTVILLARRTSQQRSY